MSETLVQVVLVIGGGLMGAGLAALGLAIIRWRRRRRAAALEAARLARIGALQAEAEEMLARRRAAGERGLVVVDGERGTVTWLPTTTAPIIGPRGRA